MASLYDDKAYEKFIAILKKLGADIDTIEKLANLAKEIDFEDKEDMKTKINKHDIEIFINLVQKLRDMNMGWETVYEFAKLALGE